MLLLKKLLHGCISFIQLTRFKEYIWAVIILTSSGAIAAHGSVDWKFAVAICANGLSMAFAFMVNDIEDAQDDMFDEIKKKRNPVSAGRLSIRTAWIASFVVCLISFILYAILGGKSFIIGSVCLVVSFIYSWKPVRLKSMPVFDIVSHCLMLAGLPFAVGYITYSQEIGLYFLWPFLMVTAFSSYGELYNELRDQKCDHEAGITHTAALLGSVNANILMLVFGILGAIGVFVTVFILHIVPIQTFAILFVMAIVLLIPPIFRMRTQWSWMKMQRKVQEALQAAAALTLIISLALH